MTSYRKGDTSHLGITLNDGSTAFRVMVGDNMDKD